MKVKQLECEVQRESDLKKKIEVKKEIKEKREEIKRMEHVLNKMKRKYQELLEKDIEEVYYEKVM